MDREKADLQISGFNDSIYTCIQDPVFRFAGEPRCVGQSVARRSCLGTPSMRESDSTGVEEDRTARDYRLTELTLFGVLPGARIVKLTSELLHPDTIRQHSGHIELSRLEAGHLHKRPSDSVCR